MYGIYYLYFILVKIFEFMACCCHKIYKNITTIYSNFMTQTNSFHKIGPYNNNYLIMNKFLIHIFFERFSLEKVKKEYKLFMPF